MLCIASLLYKILYYTLFKEIQEMAIFVAGGLTNQVVQRNDPRTEALFNPKTGLIVTILFYWY